MRVAIIGRTETLFTSMKLLMHSGYEIAVVITAKAAPEYTKTEEDFRCFAEENNIPFMQTAKIEQVLTLLSQQKAIDIGVSMNYSGIISQKVIDQFRLGILNAHGGDLPRYRGNACAAWAIINGENRIGLCIHRMIGGELDSGDIIEREYFDISDRTIAVGDCYDWMNERIPQLFLQSVNKLSKEPDFVLESQSKDPSDSLRCYPRIPADGFIKWEANSSSIERLVRASGSPFPGAFCYYGEDKLVVWRAVEVDITGPYSAYPGQILEINKELDYVNVACGKGAIRLLDTEFQGERGSPDRWIKSIRKRLE